MSQDDHIYFFTGNHNDYFDPESNAAEYKILDPLSDFKPKLELKDNNNSVEVFIYEAISSRIDILRKLRDQHKMEFDAVRKNLRSLSEKVSF